MSTKKKNVAKGKAANKPAAPKATESKPVDMSHRVLTMAEYLAMEKVASAIERACRVRRKYVMAMKGATEVIDRNLDKLREIVWNNN